MSGKSISAPPGTMSPWDAAFAAARAAGARGEVPIGAAIVRGGVILAADGNRTLDHHDPSAHAEMLAIRAACAAVESERLPECDLYVTLNPARCAQPQSRLPHPAALFRGERPEGRRGRKAGVRLYQSRPAIMRPRSMAASAPKKRPRCCATFSANGAEPTLARPLTKGRQPVSGFLRRRS